MGRSLDGARRNSTPIVRGIQKGLGFVSLHPPNLGGNAVHNSGLAW